MKEILTVKVNVINLDIIQELLSGIADSLLERNKGKSDKEIVDEIEKTVHAVYEKAKKVIKK